MSSGGVSGSWKDGTSAKTLALIQLQSQASSQNTSFFPELLPLYPAIYFLFRIFVWILRRKRWDGVFFFFFLWNEITECIDKKHSSVSCPLPSLSERGEMYDHPITMVTSRYIQCAPPTVTGGHSWQALHSQTRSYWKKRGCLWNLHLWQI